MKKKIILGIVLTLSALLVLSGCTKTSEKVIIKATNNGWDSQMLHNEIAKFIVDSAYDGYDFQMSTGSSTMNWQAIISGDVDLDIESWTDNVATYVADIESGDIVDVGVLVPNSAQGLYVPRYVIEGDAERGIEPMAPELKTVQDLKKYPELFPDDEDKTKGRIYGSIPGWMADEILYKKYEAYGLNEMYNYARLGSESTLFASLSAAYNLGDAWVGYCYEPTWISGRLDIVLLEDEPYDKAAFEQGLCEFPKQELKIVSGKDFATKAPDLLVFFQKYQTNSELISKALSHLDESGETHAETAKWLLKENENLLDEWLPADKADLVKKALQ